MYIPAISIGYAVPTESFIASVHSVFQSALNLQLNEDEHLLTLVTSGEADLPQGIRLDAPEGFSFGDLRVGDLTICRDGILHFESNSLTVQLYGARRWKCDLPTIGRTASPTCLSTWNLVWEALNQQQKLSKAEIIAEGLLHETARAGISHKVSKAMRELVDATRQYNLVDMPVKALIGLGTGLTPSGDDLLTGYMAGLWCTVQNQNERMQFIKDLGKKIIRLSSGTNDISRTYLYHATQGQVASRLADLAGAICRGENHEHIRKVAEAAFQVGHTSGMDAVTGLLIGLATWGSFYESIINFV